MIIVFLCLTDCLAVGVYVCEYVFICHINRVGFGTEMKLCIRVYCKEDLKNLHFNSIGDLGL
jgi:hypothetical protein